MTGVSLLENVTTGVEPVIVEAYMIRSDRKTGRYQAVIMATLSDGTLRDVVTFYDDELCLTAQEFEGLTMRQVSDRWMRADTAYLRS